MRSALLLTVFAAAPAVAAPLAPVCAIPGPMPIADHPAAAPAAPPAEHAAPTAALPVYLRNNPFAQHLISAGATLADLGTTHGLRTIAARHGEQFMIFQLTPDGEAAVAGALTELSPTQLAVLAGSNLSQLGTLHGLPGMFVRNGAQFQVFYATPDGARVIPGVLWDATGKDLTRAQVAGIPGAVPTVVVGDPPASAKSGTTPAPAALPLLDKAAFGTIGPAAAPHLWMLIDPQCIYSVRAFQMLAPYAEAGKMRISVVPLSVLDYEDHGQSTKSALALLSKPADQIVTAWRAGDVDTAPSADAAARLQANMAIAQAIQLKGTPTFLWRKADGSEGRLDGMPSSVPALLSSIGS